MQTAQNIVKQEKLSAGDLNDELLDSIHAYLEEVVDPCSFYVPARELLTNREVLPDEQCVLVALPNRAASGFPATAASYGAMVITTPGDEHLAALLLRDEAIALPHHAFEAWGGPRARRLLVVYQFADAVILEEVPMTESLVEDLSICAVTAQSGSRPTYAELLDNADDTSSDSPLQVLDNRHIHRKDTKEDKSSSA
ncbi:hypothetical protein [Paraburkholderia sp. RL17-337-BIB-A]|uniref:hypothetical protein n=1 Tax=Paraburkholderia sp. RL17-337-BIB-A TaxID=3031636 RepID=UPI0038B83140